MSVSNRPGLAQLQYRIGTRAGFFAAMKARLAAADMQGLAALTTRDPADPSLALFDLSATVLDILTFYQERIANEGFIGTAAERRSILELARLVGYELRPGVSAGVYLAYTCERGGDVVIPAGSKAQSVPAPGQTAQTFETSQALRACDEWNSLGIRMMQPQLPSLTPPVAPDRTPPLYLKGTAVNVKPNDMLLFVSQNAAGVQASRVVRVHSVELQAIQQRTKVEFQQPQLQTSIGAQTATQPHAAFPAAERPVAVDPTAGDATLLQRYAKLRPRLMQAPASHPANATRLARSVSDLLGPDRDAIPRLIASLHPELADVIYPALANVPVVQPQAVEVHIFRAHTAPYGHNAPLNITGYTQTQTDSRTSDSDTTTTINAVPYSIESQDTGPALYLETRFDRIVPGSYVAEMQPGTSDWSVHAVTAVDDTTRTDYGLNTVSTVLSLNPGFALGGQQSISDLANVDVYAQSEQLELVDVPIGTDFPLPFGAPGNSSGDARTIELDGLYDNLLPGRWALVTGTRTDLPGVAGTELVMIAGTEHGTNAAFPGDAVHTFVSFSHPLQYTYERAGVLIYGNVVPATHGETRAETLGSGDAGVSRQSFTLKAAPLTYVSAPTPSGVRSTLAVRVNGLLWNENDAVVEQGPTDRAYTTRTDTAGNTTVVFGDGLHGARVPTGVENIAATYRSGIGTPGNVAAGQITNLTTRPLGAKSVVNPQPASGGADPETRDAARANVASALLALDRLVSVSDYGDFARTFAGVAKVSVTQLGAGNESVVHLTVAGADDAPLDPAGDLFANLAAALRTFGDPAQAFEIHSRNRVIIVLSAQVAVSPDYLWEDVEPRVRAALVSCFGFAQRDFGQPAYLGEALAAIQSVAGVAYANVLLFNSISETNLSSDLAALGPQTGTPRSVIPSRLGTRQGGIFVPAEIVTIDPALPETLVLAPLDAAAT